MLVNTALRSAARAGTRRPMSTATPKMHKAKDVWGELKATRPPEGHAHILVSKSIVDIPAVSFGDCARRYELQI
eukprot:scaffold21961_cov67-Cyclotella_meneghiniana.AAC.8